MSCSWNATDWQKDLIRRFGVGGCFFNQPLSKDLIKPVTLIKTDEARKYATELQPANF